MTEIITFTEVSKTFRLGIRRRKTAVDGLTLTIERGKVVGLLGPNGSGKSTTLKMLLGFLKPSGGEILVCGKPAEERESRRSIGYLPENPRFQRFLTGRDVLEYYGGLLGLSAAELSRKTGELLEVVGLRHAENERVHGYSKGMTQRLAIAQALLADPPILVFDEPMSGLDPLGRFEIRRLIRRLHETRPDCTILFSTHILGDVEQLCSDVALLRKGKLVTYSPLDELLIRNEERYDVILKDPPAELKERILKNHRTETSPAGTLVITIGSTEDLLQELAEYRKQGARILSVSSQRRTLEEALFAEAKA